LKANHNCPYCNKNIPALGFKIVKKHFESKSQPRLFSVMNSELGFKIVKKHFESKSQLEIKGLIGICTWF
jgi:hypothetical protein